MGMDLRQKPQTSDGKPIFLANMFPGNVLSNHPGTADDITNGVRFGGDLFLLSQGSQGDTYREFQFLEWVYIAGGGIQWLNAEPGDWIDYRIYAPASPATSAPGSGSYMKYEVIPGINMFIPQPSGGWGLNLVEKLNANVNITKVTPVPAVDEDSGNPNGFFDWDPDTGAVTLNVEQKGYYNLFDSPMPLSRYVPRYAMLTPSFGPANLFTVPAVKPKKILPHWTHRVTIHRENSSANTLYVAWGLYVGREDTTWWPVL